MDEVKARDQQYFPTYHLSDEASDVALKEYELASSTLAAEQKVLNMSTSFLVGFIGIAAAFYKDNSAEVEKALEQGLQTSSGFIALALIFTLVTLAATSYFADTRRSVVLAARKIVILRRMLGLSYGQIELILPTRRIEGANEPYHIPMFHGWRSAKAVPIYCLAITSSVIVWLFVPRINTPLYFISNQPAISGFLWCVFVSFYYRIHLLDQYETIWRILSVSIAKIIRQPLITDFEYTIYRARLAVIEARRLNIPLDRFHPILTALEDRNFWSHNGVSIKAIIAAIYRYVRRGKRSGGSTITQQITRTLFIKDMDKLLRRKIVEILLAFWFDRQFTKENIANMYVCAVRYEKSVNGIADALRYFFPNTNPKEIKTSEIFFLLERVANIRSKLIVGKIAENIGYLEKEKLLSRKDISEIIRIYHHQIAEGRIIAKTEDVLQLKKLTSQH